MSTIDTLHRDVLIIGAGLSGINVAYRLPQGTTYEIIEARDRIGGTWDLFRYPGVRSDSDVFTLSYPFRPWTGHNSIVDGADLRDYIEDTADHYGISERITFNTRAVAANWDSESGQWTVSCEQDGNRVVYTARFLVAASGYYDYDNPHDPAFAGVEDFTGTILHPQFWPEDISFTGKNVVVIGSGATAMTLVPVLAEKAAKVTMLQRTPTYVLSQPRVDKLGNVIRAVLPRKLANTVMRSKNSAQQWVLVALSARFPSVVKRALNIATIVSTRSRTTAREHFTPPYNPWEQRLCVVPDGDLFRALRQSRAQVVTAHIDHFVADGIKLVDGGVVPADVIVTATGLRIKLLGGVELSIDGRAVDFSERYTWYGTMYSDVPNFAAVIGYINHSWTVRSDLTAKMIARILRRLRASQSTSVTPVTPATVGEGRPYMDMQSGYLSRAAAVMPRSTQNYPWSAKQNVLEDTWNTSRARLDDGLVWS